MYEILQYVSPNDKNVYLEWLTRLRDIRAKLAVVSRVRRMENGNFGDHKPCRNGVWELRIDVGAGYRLYYAMAGKQVVLLLCGGDKGSQARTFSAQSSSGTNGKEKRMPEIRNDDAMAELYAKDAGFAVQVLNDVLENGEPGELLITLRQMTRAFGGVQAVAEKADLNATQLYRTLSAEGNPTLNSLTAVLKVMGLQFAVRRIGEERDASSKSKAPKGARKKPVRAQATAVAKVTAVR